jgi:hypothetical protein
MKKQQLKLFQTYDQFELNRSILVNLGDLVEMRSYDTIDGAIMMS